MIIRSNNEYKTIYEVYMIYCSENERLYYGYSVKVNEFSFMSDTECEILDNTLNSDFILTKNDANNDMLIHKALYQNDLYRDVIEWNPEALIEFKKRKKNMKSNFDEFQNPYINTAAIILDEGYWVSCPKCLEAFEIDLNKGVVMCSNVTCKVMLNNPYAPKLPM